MANRRISSDAEQAWLDFHASVNMTGHELRTWLLTQASGEEGFRSAPDPGLPAPGRDVVEVLNKRKVDLTEADLAVMSTVVERIRDLRGNPPPDGPADTGWRHALMDLGHDPLREPPDYEPEPG